MIGLAQDACRGVSAHEILSKLNRHGPNTPGLQKAILAILGLLIVSASQQWNRCLSQQL